MRTNLTKKSQKGSKKTKRRMWTNTMNWKRKRRKNEKWEGLVSARRGAVEDEEERNKR